MESGEKFSVAARGRIVSVNVSREKGTIKQPAPEIVIDSRGVSSDAHAGDWHRQVSLLSQESIERFSERMGRKIHPGEFAENITTSGLDLGAVRLLDRFRVREVELEVTQIGKECHGEGCAIFRQVGKCVMPREGIFCRVLSGGSLCPGDEIVMLRRRWRFCLVVMSDRAARGEYSDRSGPVLQKWAEDFCQRHGLEGQVELSVQEDDAGKLRALLERELARQADAVLISGGTGIGPRDITPEAVLAFCEKTLPGVMEAIRLKYGEKNPRALLSRSVAGVRGKTLVYALPGSPRAAAEYTAEIEKTLLHAIYMLHGLDAH
jgi:molybdopterin adenylyltransferase